MVPEWRRSSIPVVSSGNFWCTFSENPGGETRIGIFGDSMEDNILVEVGSKVHTRFVSV